MKRAIEGIECVEGESYRRTVLEDGRMGTVEVVHLPQVQSIAATIRFPCVRSLPGIVARIRRVFDLGADISAIGTELGRDPLLGQHLQAAGERRLQLRRQAGGELVQLHHVAVARRRADQQRPERGGEAEDVTRG